MKELQDILRQYAAACAAGRACALATVVRAAGSTYRRPGARMLITDDGNVTGCVSGGCLERTVFDEARGVLQSREPKAVRFDSLSDDDVVWGFGLGCNGVVEILIEPLSPKSSYLAFLADCVESREDATLATVFAVDGRAVAKIGERMMMRANGDLATDISDDSLRTAAAFDARRVLNGASQTISYEFPGGSASVFVEHIQPPLALVVFGAGHDAVPLVRMAKELRWQVTMVDYRPANVSRARGLSANAVIVARPEEIAGKVRLDRRGAVVVMNHNYLDDLAVLETVLKSPLRYIGVLGPRVRTERMLADLRKRGISPTGAEIGRLYAPAGLDIGADNPEEIALSIVVEIQAAISNRPGESLRETSGPLHGRIEEKHVKLATANGIEKGLLLPKSIRPPARLRA